MPDSRISVSAEAAPEFADRLLAEAVRLHEEARGAPLDEPGADEAARATPGDFEYRVSVRAGRLSIAQPLRAALHHLRTGISARSGARPRRRLRGRRRRGAGGAGLVRRRSGQLLPGAHRLARPAFTIALLIWLIFIVFRPGSAAIGLLGGLVMRLGGRLTRSLHKGPLELAAVRAAGGVFFGAGLGRWALSTISHCVWLAYLAGCLVVVVLLLSTRQYDFAWETTILSEPAYVRMVRLIALPVQALGFAVPDAGQIGASRWTGKGAVVAEAREAWGSLLIGCIVVYGLLPRGLALVATIGALLRARSRYRLDHRHVGYVRLHSRLMPLSRQTGIVDAEEADERDVASPPRPRSSRRWRSAQPGRRQSSVGRSTGPPAVGRRSCRRSNGGTWVSPTTASTGGVSSTRWRRRGDAPRCVLVVCSLAATPDRGTRAFIDALRRASTSPLVLLLTEGQRLRGRVQAEQAEERIQDWRRLASECRDRRGSGAGARSGSSHRCQPESADPAARIRRARAGTSAPSSSGRSR